MNKFIQLLIEDIGENLSADVLEGKTLKQAILDGDIGGSGSAGTITTEQLNLLGITGATPEEPKEYIISSPDLGPDFKRLPISILKFEEQGDDLTKTVSEFKAGEIGDYTANDITTMDGTLDIKNSFTQSGSKSSLGVGYTYGVTLDKNKFKEFVSFGI